MTQISEAATLSNEEIYERLISLIDNNQEQLTLIIVSCDDLRLRQRMIDRYEQEAKQSKIQSHRIVLGMEPSLRAGLAKLGLPTEEQVVVTVTGAEWLLRVKTRSIDEQSDLDKFFGYLQWTREGLREFRYPIVLWVTYPILREMSRRAPDFWSWRKAVLRFAAEEEVTEPIDPVEQSYLPLPVIDRLNDDFLPPPAVIISEIQQLAARDPESANLPVLYQKLAGIYAQRIDQGEATNLEQEQQQAIDAFEEAVDRYRKLNKRSALATVLNDFGNFLRAICRYGEAIELHQKSLNIYREISDLNGEARSFGSLGHAYRHLGQYQRAINFYQQSLKIHREIGDYRNESVSLNGLGISYRLLGKYQQAIDFHQKALKIQQRMSLYNDEAISLNNLGNIYNLLGQPQRALYLYQKSLDIYREIGDLNGEAGSLGNLGNVYQSLKQYQQSITFYQLSSEIRHKIGDRHGEAISLFNQALTFTEYESGGLQALDKFQQARSIFLELNLDAMVKRCDAEINKFNAMIAPE
jgi:tetratricopeptide (TPR) repeat protein